MMGYNWGIDGRRYGEDKPLAVRAGERVALVMRNRTMMAHPMHLHGHRFQVAAIGDQRIAGAMRDTVLVPAMGSVAVLFDADNPGQWAFHCHNAYHMAAGMMTSLRYEA
jgi:FtsP/CotA-like multicopper oxidase with cupredoxin domain